MKNSNHLLFLPFTGRFTKSWYWKWVSFAVVKSPKIECDSSQENRNEIFWKIRAAKCFMYGKINTFSHKIKFYSRALSMSNSLSKFFQHINAFPTRLWSVQISKNKSTFKPRFRRRPHDAFWAQTIATYMDFLHDRKHSHFDISQFYLKLTSFDFDN